ncbi:hypothetical protein Agub_g15034 [Astrephomene gubernaculifera]|uniref:Helicase C-terminal domain-containing protein n=1 Tax=Astrephomene gubernaculifera TaxID=47775 RepID=A0AAD3HSR3_9CHLO|nr:hypothetical protein Agub_g15034 [Astrephomene gubernaculifera]
MAPCMHACKQMMAPCAHVNKQTPVQVAGSDELMVKITALVRRLVWLRDERPDEKSLVFSQWPEALQIVERGLQLNGIRCVTLESGRRGRSAVKAFLNDDSCRVFLLSLRQGAAGLTLVRANHVFLLEPSLDPAIEQQAVARVHRIGQERPVRVTRLLVEGSVEEKVMMMLQVGGWSAGCWVQVSWSSAELTDTLLCV